MKVDIEEVLRLETELKTQGGGKDNAPFATGVAAKVNMLKYLQVQAVMEYQ